MALRVGGGEPIKPRTRYPSIDIMRGLALVSMASSHVMHYRLTSVIGKFFHSGVWIDGAFFFVALSGVVVGLIHRRIVERAGLRPSIVKLARRAGFLYVVHVGLTLTAMCASWIDHDNLVGVPSWNGLGALPWVIGRVLWLRLQPEDNGVLPIYVVFMLLAIPAVILLHRGHWRAVVISSLAIYLGAWIVGGISFVPGEFQPLAWQALFMGGLLVGWTWEHERLALPAYWRSRIVFVGIAGASMFYALARLAPGHTERFFGNLLDKMAGGPLAFLYSALVMVAAYTVLERLLRWSAMPAILTPIRILGSKGLPGYAALQVCALTLDLFPRAPRNDFVLIVVIMICGITEYTAVRLQQSRKKSLASPAASTSDIAGEEPREQPLTDLDPNGPASTIALSEPAAQRGTGGRRI